MQGTRLRILQLLQRSHSETVDGLARAIALAPATIRRHLDILQRDRLVAFREVRKKTGRPEYSFYLTEGGQEALPKGYAELLGMVVQEMSSLDSSDTRQKDGQQLLELVFERLAAGLTDPLDGEVRGKDLGQRLAILTGNLEEREFYPESNVVGGDLRIQLHNCPFRSVALQNRALCVFDSNLISSLLGRSVERRSCIHDGDEGCMYVVELADEEAVQVVNASPA